METDEDEAPAPATADEFALVWIDAEGARILRWRGKLTEVRVPSDIPVHERSTYHVRHDPRVRYGGGGRGADEAARHRTEHVRRFLALVEATLGAEETLEVLGTGELCQRLASQIRRHDRTHHRNRPVTVDQSMRLTRPQLVARLRQRIGLAPIRGVAGAYRWSGDLPRDRSGRVRGPRRVASKPLR